jgi:hypothetical protein
MTTATIVRSNSAPFHRTMRVALMLAVLACLVLAATTASTAQTYTDLHDFSSNGPNDPFFSVIAQGRDGNMYTTSEQGFTGKSKRELLARPIKAKRNREVACSQATAVPVVTKVERPCPCSVN